MEQSFPALGNIPKMMDVSANY